MALLSTLVIGAVIYILSKGTQARARKADSLLQFAFTLNGNGQAPYLPVLRKYCRQHTVINTRTLGEPNTLELSFYVNLRSREANDHLVRELRAVEGVSSVNLFYDDEAF